MLTISAGLITLNWICLLQAGTGGSGTQPAPSVTRLRSNAPLQAAHQPQGAAHASAKSSTPAAGLHLAWHIGLPERLFAGHQGVMLDFVLGNGLQASMGRLEKQRGAAACVGGGGGSERRWCTFCPGPLGPAGAGACCMLVPSP